MRQVEKRNNSRIDCDYDYYCSQRSFGNKIQCTLKNISATGACITSTIELDNEESIILHICRGRDISFASKVVWREGATYGLELELNTSEDLDNISYLLNNINYNNTFS